MALTVFSLFLDVFIAEIHLEPEALFAHINGARCPINMLLRPMTLSPSALFAIVNLLAFFQNQLGSYNRVTYVDGQYCKERPNGQHILLAARRSVCQNDANSYF